MLDKITQSGFGLVKKFLPASENKPLVGLDVGNFSCKAVELTHDGNGYHVASWANELILGTDKVSATKKALAKLTAPANVVPVTSVAGKGTLIRFIDMPRMAIADLKKSFAIEADKYFPFPLDQIYTDCYILDANVPGNKMRVMVAAVKKELVDQRLSLLSEVGFQTDYITLNAVAVINAMQTVGGQELAAITGLDKNPSVAYGILDVGEVITNLTIMVNGVPRFIRDIFIGGRDFTRAISNSLATSLEEAARLKIQPGEKKQALAEACEMVAANMVTELRLSLDYFSTEENLAVAQVFLTGGSAGLEGMAESLAKNLDVKIVRWLPFQPITLAEGLRQEDFDRDAAQLAVALGLALTAS